MKSDPNSQNRYRSLVFVLFAFCVAFPGAGIALADDHDHDHDHDHSGRVDVNIPGLGGLNVQWGEPQPVNAPYVVQTRGPVHEAFAEPIMYDPAPDFVIPQQPPPPLDEVPPQVYPVSSTPVAWIPGYWAWDDDRNSFLWVSGIWRNVPPGRQFVPGYWLQLTTGFQWVPGFWTSDQAETVQYLPQPPESLERGPTSDPPEPGAVWVPGVWVWHDSQYLWRPGYWTRSQPGWVWVPDHYVWSPSGYVFVTGYYDYSLDRRGVLFAPIYVTAQVAAAPRFVYRPSVVVNTTALIADLFTRPRYVHYYFGDYYERQYFQAGIYPAYSFYDSDFGYDPIFAHYVAVQRVPRADVIQRFRTDYRYLRDNPRVRPPHTYREFQQLAGRRDLDPRLASRTTLVEPLRQYAEARQPDRPFRFERLESDRLNQYRQTVTQTRQYQQERQRLEGQNLREAPTAPGVRTPAPGVSRERQVEINRQRPALPTPGRVERTVPEAGQPAAPGAAPPRPTPPPAQKPAPQPGRATERPTPPAQPPSPSIPRERTTEQPKPPTPTPPPAPKQPAATPAPAPSAPPSIRREQLPEETQKRLRPATPAQPAAPGKPGAEARPATPGQPPQPTARTAQPPARGPEAGANPPGQARSPAVERRSGNPVQLRLNRSPLGGQAATTQSQAGAARGQPPAQARPASPPAPKAPTAKAAQPEQKGKPQQPPRERRAPKED